MDIKFELEDDLNYCKSRLKLNKIFLLLSFISDIVLSFLYYYFVIGKGNIFDHIVSISILLFFTFQIGIQFYLKNKRSKERKKLQREYNIACETPEQTLNRTRKEKFERILKNEKSNK